MFGLSRKIQLRNIEKSLVKYSDVLKADKDLTIRMKHKGKFYSNYVENINNKEVLFRALANNEDIVGLKENTIIEVEFLDSKKLYKTRIVVVDRIMENDIIHYKGRIHSPIEERERRKHYRLPIIIDLNYSVLPRESIEFIGNTLDISTSGMLLETYEDIKQGSNVKVNIELYGKVYSIESDVLRRRKNYSNGTYLYNLRFNDLKNRHKNEISRFIFDHKRELKRKSIK